MRRRICGCICTLIIASIGLLGLTISASASNGPAQDGACPPPYHLESVFAIDTPSAIALRMALDAQTGSIDNQICVLNLNENAPFPRNLIDNLVQS